MQLKILLLGGAIPTAALPRTEDIAPIGSEVASKQRNHRRLMRRYRLVEEDDVVGDNKLLVSDLGLALHCCDVHPPEVHPLLYSAATFGDDRPCDIRLGASRPPICDQVHAAGGHHGGGIDWKTVALPKDGTVYVPAADMGSFLLRFTTLRRDTRLTVVSGLEDVGMPRELFNTDVHRRLPSSRGPSKAYEFNPYRFALNCSTELFPGTKNPLRNFLADERLVHLFVQNYDLRGCSPHSDSRFGNPASMQADHNCRGPLQPSLMDKVTPIPIGISLWHGMSAKYRMTAEGGVPVAAPMTLEQDVPDFSRPIQSGIARARALAKPFAQRKLSVFAPFACIQHELALSDAVGEGIDSNPAWEALLKQLVYDEGSKTDDFAGQRQRSGCRMAEDPASTCVVMPCFPPGLGSKYRTMPFEPPRTRACAAIRRFSERAAVSGGRIRPHMIAIPKGETKGSTKRLEHEDYLARTTDFAFVLAPPGHGTDTYRVWEVLALGGVPVVVSTSLDKLYEQLPIIIIKNWTVIERLTDAVLERWRSQIQAKFPLFANGTSDTQVRSLLSLEYWVDLIKSTHAAGTLPRGPGSEHAAAPKAKAVEAAVLPYDEAALRSCCYEGHGWQTSCVPPCTLLHGEDLLRVRGAFDRSVLSASSSDILACAHDAKLERPWFAPMGHNWSYVSLSIPRPGANAAYFGKVLRIRTPMQDGFWVRAIFVLALGTWASKMGIPFFVEPHVNAACGAPSTTCSASIAGLTAPSSAVCTEKRICDAFHSPSEGLNAWEQYFEPIEFRPATEMARAVKESRIIELDGLVSWGLFAGFQNIYPAQYAAGLAQRMRMSALVEQWVKPRGDIMRMADETWQRIVGLTSDDGGAPPVIGVHLRGTDKFLQKLYSPQDYFPFVDAFLEARRGALIFLATDDAAFARQMADRYGDQLVQQEGVSRASGKDAIWRAQSSGTARAKGVQVLLDSLLLARCDYLLKSASAVSEFAIYFNPRLAHDSYDFNIEDGPRPHWMPAKKQKAASTSSSSDNDGQRHDQRDQQPSASSSSSSKARLKGGARRTGGGGIISVTNSGGSSNFSVPFGCIEAQPKWAGLRRSTFTPADAAAALASCPPAAYGLARKLSRKLQVEVESIRSRAAAHDCKASRLLRVGKVSFQIGWTSHLHAWLKPAMQALTVGKAMLSPVTTDWMEAKRCHAASLRCFFESLAPPVCDEHSEEAARRNQLLFKPSELETITPNLANPKFEDDVMSHQRHGDAIIPEKYRPLGWMWWASKTVGLLTKPNPELLTAVQLALEQTGLGAALQQGLPVLGLQVRQGDACTNVVGGPEAHGRQCESLARYMEYAKAFRSVSGVRTIYLATDSQDVLAQTKQYPDFTFIHYAAAHAHMDALNKKFPPSSYAWDDIVRENVRRGQTADNMRAAWLTTIDVMLLAKCDFFIGQFTSNVFRLAYELKVNECDCAPPYVSLDSSWCFDWPLRANVNPKTGSPIIC